MSACAPACCMQAPPFSSAPFIHAVCIATLCASVVPCSLALSNDRGNDCSIPPHRPRLVNQYMAASQLPSKFELLLERFETVILILMLD